MLVKIKNGAGGEIRTPGGAKPQDLKSCPFGQTRVPPLAVYIASQVKKP